MTTTPQYILHEVRDSTTAGSQRLALSGLQSRLHTIRKYTFPPSSAEAAAAELVRLYVQKGHDHQACHRFLKKAPTTATCVCLGQGFPTATSTHTFQPRFHRQGATAPFISLWPTKLLMFGEDMNLGRQVHVPATGLNCCPISLVCFHGGSTIPPLNIFPPLNCSRALTACECISTGCSIILCCGLMHLAVPSPSFSTWEQS